MARPRRLPRLVGMAVAGAGIALASPAPAQFDMTPYRPFNARYRTSAFPAEMSATGDAAFAPPAPVAVMPEQARVNYSARPFDERVAEDLETSALIRGERAPAPGSGAARRLSAADARVVEDRTLRDRYYFQAQREQDPKRRAELMEAYRRENRRLERALAVRPQAVRPLPRQPAAAPATGTAARAPR